jgi:hypothetical protein
LLKCSLLFDQAAVAVLAISSERAVETLSSDLQWKFPYRDRDLVRCFHVHFGSALR